MAHIDSKDGAEKSSYIFILRSAFKQKIASVVGMAIKDRLDWLKIFNERLIFDVNQI